jgi:hypothetical protein
MLTAINNPDECASHAERNREVIERKADAVRNRRLLAEKLEDAVIRSRGGQL